MKPPPGRGLGFPDLRDDDQPNAAATARFAITVTTCARYSAEAWMSELRPLSGCLTFATDSGANFAASAFSISFCRNTHGPAPVTATRGPPEVSATKTPTIA